MGYPLSPGCRRWVTVAELELSRPREPAKYEVEIEQARQGRPTADYLFPPSAVMTPATATTRVPGRLAAPRAFPRSSTTKLAYLFRTWRHRRSGTGADKGVGMSADCILGAWTCCRHVEEDKLGCVAVDNAHTVDGLKCAQCGLTFAYLDNRKAMELGNHTCLHHGAEPSASR